MSRNPNPKPRIIQGGSADPAFTGICHWCEKTRVSIFRPFPTPYVCGDCLTALELERENRVK